ncbi:MAG TPA: DUF362 domain-containing protein [Syntrophobacteraceae bacterium]|nr:DUF362 domain-containing protein [Syntrophobacteraceae bacterium]
MASKVFFIDLAVRNNQGLLDRIPSLLEAAGIAEVVPDRALTAIKIHFGERGNTAFVRPLLVRPIVDAVAGAGGRPFLTDAGTLYVGTRGNAVDHLNTAMLNGFAYSVVGAPLVIADGLDGGDEVAVPVELKHCRVAYVASAVAKARALVSVAHFKLHEAAGFGGAIKNLGMGSASRKGKMAQHSDSGPLLEASKCIGCGLCREQCAHDAITLVDRADAESSLPMASIDHGLCVGCARCIHTCPQGALGINWEKDLPRFMERMVEYTAATLKGKEENLLCINFLTQVSPACDCYPFADSPVVADIGVVASRDPVAVDQASMDLVNAQPPLGSSCIKDSPHASHDKVRAVYPQVQWEHQLAYAEQLKMGSRTYDLVKL